MQTYVSVQGPLPLAFAKHQFQVSDHVTTQTGSKDHFLAKALIALVARDHCPYFTQSMSKDYFIGVHIPGISLPFFSVSV